jgi:hypothetical protein
MPNEEPPGTPPPVLPVDPGLCGYCRYASVKATHRGTTYLRCTRSAWDERLPKYPRLPVRDCPGFAREDGLARLSVPGPRLGLMAESRLSVSDRELFLAEPHIAALSVVAGPDRGPLTVPMWYQYTPGGEAWILTQAASRKARLIADAGRFTLMVERLAPTIRYVSIEGPVSRTIPATDELEREITERYLPPEKVPDYLALAKAEFGPQVVIYLRPQRWLSQDLGPS